MMVARVLYDKGYQEYVDAAEIVKKKYLNIDIELLGPLDETSPMGVPKSVVEQDVKANKIKYLGVTNDVPSYLRRDGVVVVVSSYHEGLNRSLMEACAMARPVITTNIAGCRETVEQGVNGYIVIPKDKQSLAEAMIRFIELPQKEKQEMAENSYRKAVRCFDVKIVLKKYDEIISELIS
ncbi:MAG: glycosyltransferase [Bacteroidota bacterium]|nr:glycosyltransferase [Bacteroidota bacterium]